MTFPSGKPKLQPLNESLDDPTWEVLEDFVYHSAQQNLDVFVAKGFITDLASVPRWPGASEIAAGQANSASVVHDWLYTTTELPKISADRIFLEAMNETGVQNWRAKMMYDAVLQFGGSHYGKKPAVKLP